MYALTPKTLYEWACKQDAENLPIFFYDQSRNPIKFLIDADKKREIITFKQTTLSEGGVNDNGYLPYYGVKRLFATVRKSKFNDYINNYPRRLDVIVSPSFDPPLLAYVDKLLSTQYPYNVVARTLAYSDNPSDKWYVPKDERHYEIVRNIDAVFASRKSEEREVFVTNARL